jgi:ParB family chromosome partitioning protein
VINNCSAYIRIANDNESLMALVENIQRHDLDPIEIALSPTINWWNSIDSRANEWTCGKNDLLTNYLRLLKLDPIIQTGIRDGFISMVWDMWAIINIEDSAQTSIYQKIVSQNLSVRDTEALVKNYQESLKQKIR